MPTLTMEDQYMQEKIKRLVNKLYDEQDIEGLHEVAHLLLNGMFQHKIAMYFFKEEAVKPFI